MMNVEQLYRKADAYLEGHFKLSSGKHSQFYLQSAKVLENTKVAGELAAALATQIRNYGLEVDTVCAPALGGILAGYELARALEVRSIFAERADGTMTLRRGFDVKPGEKVIICEDIITTGGSALEAAKCIEAAGGVVVAFAALANRGFCTRTNDKVQNHANPTCKLPNDLPFFALDDFNFEVYDPKSCPLCKDGSEAIKPGSRGD